jgi:endonuclease III
MAKSTASALSADLLRVCEALEVRYGQRKATACDDFIEGLVYQILELATPERSAREALKRIKDEYVDWNDMRVATVREIQDILGPRYPRCREKAEDLSSLLADLYTAFRRMDLHEMVRTPEGIETLRALPETTLIREDMVERALLEICHVHTFPCDEEQFRLLKFLGGAPKNANLETFREKIEEALDDEQLLRLSRGLREHTDLLIQEDEDEPQAIDFKWDQPDPLTATGGAKKSAAKKKSAAPAKKPSSGSNKTVAKKAASKQAPAKKKTAAKKK